ncbi:ribonuclease H-like domain-containing protein [Tanacetum coccineum]
MVPRAVLMKSGLVSLNTARQVNTAHPKITMNSARPMTNLSKSTHSFVKWPIHKNTAFKNNNFNLRVNTIEDKKFNTARPKVVVNTARPKAVVNAVMGNNVTDVKALACWVWKPKTKVLDHVSKHNNYEEIDGGYVAFVDNPKGGKITGRYTIKTVPRKNNMYSVDLKNIVPNGGLTCHFTKATSDESKLWHRRLGHINFKTMNKLVKGNLVRAKRKNRTLIEAAGTMLADSKLPTTFWAEAVNTACYVKNRVLVTKPYNKTPYELFVGIKPALGFMRPFGYLVTILNTIDHLGKFDGKAGSGPNWIFDIDALTKSMNYKPVVAGNQSNGNACTKACDDAGKAGIETSSPNDGSKPSSDDGKKVDENPRKESEFNDQEKEDDVNSTDNVNVASINEVNVVGAKTSIEPPDDLNMPALEDIVYSDDDEDVGVEVDMKNLDAFMPVSPIPTTRIHKDHPVEQIIGD